MNRKYGAFSSSVDPQKLAATFSGLIKAAASGLVLFGLISADDATLLNTAAGELVEQFGTIATALGVIYGIGQSLYGLARKARIALGGE